MTRGFIYRFADFGSAREAVLELDKLSTDVVTGINYFKRGELFIMAAVMEGGGGDIAKAQFLVQSMWLPYDNALSEVLDEEPEFEPLGDALPFMRGFKTG